MLGEVQNIFILPFMVLFGLIFSLAGLLVVIYAIYDVLVNQKHMRGEEKAIWVILILLSNFIGAVIYLLVVKTGNIGLLKSKDIGDLERLAELKDKEVLTEEEFEELKKKIIKDIE